MTQYIVTNPETRASIRVEGASKDHARLLAALTNADAFTESNGVWMHTEEITDAAARFREALALTLDVKNDRVQELLDLFQEALDETRESALDDAARYPYN